VSPGATAVELGELGLDRGGHVLVRLALGGLGPGDRVVVCGRHPELAHQLATWCRQHGHRWHPAGPSAAGTVGVRAGAWPDVVGAVERGRTAGARWVGAGRAGDADPSKAGALAEVAPAGWGLAARGAAIEPGGPAPRFALDRRDALWTDRATALYRQAAAAQWDPATAIDWDAPVTHGPAVEAAIVQVMTFLVENEEAALVVPARFLGQVHPHFREVQQVIAVTLADEARHIEVFTRRAVRGGGELALSTVGGRASLQTLVDEPDFAVASFLLSVMGEGTFVSLLGFLEHHAPDPLTRRIAQLARNDEARHVAFAMAHLERHAALEVDLRARLARAVEHRHRELQSTAGLNDEVFDALVLLAAGEATPDAVAAGWLAVQDLQREMQEARQGRLARLGFSPGEADTIASLHTRNFM
jgi:hypothetical protein